MTYRWPVGGGWAVVRATLSLAIAGALLAGCRLPSDALDGPLAVPLRITATAESVDIDAPGWFAPKTSVYLCSSEPASLPEPGPDRNDWTPGTTCHAFGQVDANDGLHAVLATGDLTREERESFAAVADWFVLLVRVDNGYAAAAIHSSFRAPVLPAS